MEAIFSAPTKADAMTIVDHYSRYWMDIVGTRGFKGDKTLGPRPMFNALFTMIDQEETDEQQEEEVLDAGKLRELESSIDG